MKLNPDFITHTVNDEQIMVSVSNDDFHGLVRSNETAAFIIDHLREETDEKKLLAALLEEYDVSEAMAREDIGYVLDTLRKINALDE